jgi:carbon-monoxide dehydrogenase iron sulfur subunit
MKMMMIHPNRCTGCQNCELACSIAKGSGSSLGSSRIHVFTWMDAGISVPTVCQQCGDAPCVSVCPTGAMHQDVDLGYVVWDSDRCIRCKMCTQACPFGDALYSSEQDAILKCDTCRGDPQCVKNCPERALEWVEDRQSTFSRRSSYAERFREPFGELQKEGTTHGSRLRVSI